MRIDVVKTVLAIVLSTLLAYAFYSISSYESKRLLLAIVSFVELSVLTVASLGIKLKETRTSWVLMAWTVAVCIVACAMNLVFSFFDFNIPTFVILNGLLVIIYLLVYSCVYKAHQ